MSLPTLNWRKLPTRTLLYSADQCSSVILNNIYDMLTGSLYYDGSPRVTGSNSAWKNVGRFITGSGTGSNTEAVYCYPPTQTAISQSVILAARNQYGARSTGYFQAAINRQTAIVTGSGTPSGVAGGFGSIFMACVKNAGSYTSWFTASNDPFGSGSVSTGFAPVAAAIMISSSNPPIDYNDNLQITIYESQEAIALSLYKPKSFINPTLGSDLRPIHFFGMAGAIVDPEQTITSVDAEADNRLYGVVTAPFSGGLNVVSQQNRVPGISDAFYGSTNSNAGNLFDHSAFDNYHPTFTLLTPQSTSSFGVTFFSLLEPPTSDYYTLSGKFVKTPITIKSKSAPQRYVGRLRDINMIRQYTSNIVLTNQTGSIYGFTIGQSGNDLCNTILLNY